MTDEAIYQALVRAVGEGTFSIRYLRGKPNIYFTAEIDGSAVTASVDMYKLAVDLYQADQQYWKERRRFDARLEAISEMQMRRRRSAMRALERKLRNARPEKSDTPATMFAGGTASHGALRRRSC
jgi:hypothetical protein